MFCVLIQEVTLIKKDNHFGFHWFILNKQWRISIKSAYITYKNIVKADFMPNTCINAKHSVNNQKFSSSTSNHSIIYKHHLKIS